MPQADARHVDASPPTSPAAALSRASHRVRRPWSPLLWALFSAGGTVAALLYPVHLLLTGFAFPLGWLSPPDHGRLLDLARHPLSRAYLLVLIALPLFHWAHRFRYTLYDGLQLKHLERPLAALCYGGAVVGTVVAAYVIWRL
jgi:fumarate reductase subunit D